MEKFMSKIRTPPDLKGLDGFASKAAMVSDQREQTSDHAAARDKTPLDQEEGGQPPGIQKTGRPGKEEVGRQVKKNEPLPVLERQKPIATSLYFYDEDRKRLEALVQNVNALAPSKKISISLILRGLLKMSEQAEPKDVLAAIKDVSFDV